MQLPFPILLLVAASPGATSCALPQPPLLLPRSGLTEAHLAFAQRPKFAKPESGHSHRRQRESPRTLGVGTHRTRGDDSQRAAAMSFRFRWI
jgi:hypothetical protein